MKVVIAGGGTAGHTNPGLVLARALAARGDSVGFIGTRSGIEARLVPESGFELDVISIVGRERGFSPKNVVAAAKLVSAVFSSIHLLARAGPDVVVGMGGYVSLPVLVAARLLRIPVVLHEQNAVPGLANRLGARLATAIGVSLPGSESRFGRWGDRARLVGNPVPEQIATLRREESRGEATAHFGLAPGRRTLLVFGGSQGAAGINDCAFGAYEAWRDVDRLQVLHLVGPRNLDDATGHYERISSSSDAIVWRIVSYTDRMDLAYAAADLAVCRAGATTLAELAATGLPAILIPLPAAIEGDQLRNAETAVAAGGGELILHSDLSPPLLAARVEELIYDDQRLHRMAEGMRQLWMPGAAERLADLVREAAGTGESAGPGRVPAGVSQWRRAHLIGAGGARLGAIGMVLNDLGVEITGSDKAESPMLDALRARGASVHAGHASGRVAGADVVVVSNAVPQDNIELAEARSAGIPVIGGAEALARLVAGKRTVAIAGTHGKTTTSGMVTAILEEASREPTYLIGADPFDRGKPGGRWGTGEWAVVEADEAYGSFLELEPEIAVVTNIEADHLDFYGSIEHIEEAFQGFAAKTTGVLVVCADDERAMRLRGVGAIVTYGFEPHADVRPEDLELSYKGSSFGLWLRDRIVAEVNVPIAGRHHVSNALAAAAAADAAGVSPDVIARGLGSFAGVSRRFEYRGSRDGVDLIDDFAHHPTEIEANLAAARLGPWSRIVAVFQPHLYSRTQALAREFGEALSAADLVVVTDVYPAREEPVPGVTGKLIVDAACEAAPGKRVVYLPKLEAAAGFLDAEVRPGDVVLCLGAGDVTWIADRMLKRA